MTSRLRVGVPAHLLELEPLGGHGKVWHRVLAELAGSAEIVPLRGPRRRRTVRAPRRLDVLLASGHEELPQPLAPLVVQVHEAGWFEPELRSVLDPRFLASMAPRTEHAVRAASQVICPSEAARRELIAEYGLNPGRVHAVHHGVDPVFSPDATGDIPAGPYVLYAASLHPRKNLAAVREAVAALAADGLPHRLVVAGGPAPDRADSSDLERAAVAELSGAPGRIIRIDQPAEGRLAALMAGAAAFCLPSLYEGFGLTALEAMACGAPVIVSDRGSLPEVVGEAGIAVAPTAGAIHEALRRMLLDLELAAQLSQAGIARARQFSWESTAAGWLAVLQVAAVTSAHRLPR
jgi:glycosyltransferase involved in cell wall biosynthesis